jgi:methylated-DNA-protein-cysteine methyltransferase related protein
VSWSPVYKLVKQVPRGRVTTYGALAKALKLPGGARAAGWAIAACPRGQGIPWHRVVGAGGKIRMPEPTASLQRRLLQSEGVVVEGVSLNFKTYGWAPAKMKKNQKRAAKNKVSRARFAPKSRL